MKKLTTILAIAAAGLALGGCGEAPEPVEVTATETVTHTMKPSTTTSESPTTTTPTASPTHAEPEAARQEAFTPGDPRLVSVDSIGTVGMFMDPDTGQYYVCNGGEVTSAQGPPVESGTCAGPFADYYKAGQVASRLADSISAAMEQFIDEQGLNTAVDEGDITARFWECMENGGTEETCLQ